MCSLDPCRSGCRLLKNGISLVGLRLWGALRCLRQRTDDSPGARSILKALCWNPLASRSTTLAARTNVDWSAFSPRSSASDDGSRQGLCATPPSASRSSFDRVSVEFERGRYTDHRERIGETIADFQVGVICRKAPRRKLDRRDDLVPLQIVVAYCGVFSGAVRWKSENAIARGPAGPARSHRCVESCALPRTCRRDASRRKRCWCPGSQRCDSGRAIGEQPLPGSPLIAWRR